MRTASNPDRDGHGKPAEPVCLPDGWPDRPLGGAHDLRSRLLLCRTGSRSPAARPQGFVSPAALTFPRRVSATFHSPTGARSPRPAAPGQCEGFKALALGRSVQQALALVVTLWLLYCIKALST